mgnify:CR=1 FL=1
MITKTNYLEFQKRLKTNKLYRYFWQFWSNYSFVFFVVVGLIILTNPALFEIWKPLMFLSFLSFVIARMIVVFNINLLYSRERPYQKFGFDPITSWFFSYKTHTPNSFPSRHSAAFFSVAAVVCLFVPALGAFLLIVSGITGTARVVLGYHWPSDILAGAIIGAIVGILTVYLGYPIIFT